MGGEIMRRIGALIGAVLLVTLWAVPAAAVVVNLQDEQGRPLEGFTISVFNQDSGNLDTATTDSYGRFQLYTLPLGADEPPGDINFNDNVLIVGQGMSDGSVSFEGVPITNQRDFINLGPDTLTVRNIQQHGAFPGFADPPPFATCGPGPCDHQTFQTEMVQMSLRGRSPIQVVNPVFQRGDSFFDVFVQVDLDAPVAPFICCIGGTVDGNDQ
jgi:hypothetical protein